VYRSSFSALFVLNDPVINLVKFPLLYQTLILIAIAKALFVTAIAMADSIKPPLVSLGATVA
jgi:hypothetical protein